MELLFLFLGRFAFCVVSVTRWHIISAFIFPFSSAVVCYHPVVSISPIILNAEYLGRGVSSLCEFLAACCESTDINWLTVSMYHSVSRKTSAKMHIFDVFSKAKQFKLVINSGN